MNVSSILVMWGSRVNLDLKSFPNVGKYMANIAKTRIKMTPPRKTKAKL